MSSPRVRRARKVLKTILYSEFGLTFLDAKEDSGARTRHSSFDTNVLEVNEADFDKFIAEVYNAKEKY